MMHEVQEEVVRETAVVSAPRERPQYGPSLLRYVAHHKSMAVQAALLANPRKLREVALVLLLTSHLPGSPVRIDLHSRIRAFAESEPPKGYLLLKERISALLRKLGLAKVDEAEGPLWPFTNGHDQFALYELASRLADGEIGDLLAIILVLSFGQECVDRPEQPDSFCSQVTADLDLSRREWWTPDEKFLSILKRQELERVAIESDANVTLGRLSEYKKRDLVSKLAGVFRENCKQCRTA